MTIKAIYYIIYKLKLCKDLLLFLYNLKSYDSPCYYT